MNEKIRQICQRMRLRVPQLEALESFSQALSLFNLNKEVSLDDALEGVQSVFPTIQNFERNFPNLAFSLATGVGKTRLMGAMISYLVLNHNVRDFVVLAPNNTILEKLTREFSTPSHPKYIFRGISEFVNHPPKIITGHNFDEGYGVRSSWAMQPEFSFADRIHINLFNIAMIHSDNRRMKNPRETIIGGISYFEYLAQQEKLVVLMDEAHRYRATSATKAIEELRPVLGVELTATPKIEKNSRTVLFQNVLYDYPLSRAREDGFIKEPVVVGRENFQASQFNSESLEKLKLEDGVRVHEITKIHLQNFAYGKGRPLIKPFMLVIAENMSHANRLESIIKSADFFEGRYQNKVRVVHSGVKPEEEERMVKDLLEIESPQNPIEIVIHVNMLKEGWDVVNLYTIVPLRAANSKVLIEQSLGRGLRLPYGERTGIDEVDQLKIVSHDRFDEIVEEARKPDSIIRAGSIIGKDLPLEGIKNFESRPVIVEEVSSYEPSKRIIAERVLQEIDTHGSCNRERILERVKECVESSENDEIIKSTVEQVIDRYDQLAIKIPRILVEPEIVKPGKFNIFTLDLSTFFPQPLDQSILVQSLEDGTRRKIHADSPLKKGEPLTHTIAKDLLIFNDVPETEDNLTIILDLAHQMISHLSSYLCTAEEVENVVLCHRDIIVKHIHGQLQRHFEEPEYRYSSKIERNFAVLKTAFIPLPEGQEPLPYDKTPDNISLISSYVFTGFTKSQYTLCKFHSNTERVFACILEQDLEVKKWIRPHRESLNLFYHKDKQYEPDFIVETANHCYLCEVKSSAELEDLVVLQKANAAVKWCEAATEHALKNNGKPWVYLLIPHTEVRLTSSFQGLADKFLWKTGKRNND